MDIYSFINSRDVAAHCREINKVWTPFEMAVIIGRSRQPMTEKHEAWRELTTDYPDMPTPEGLHHESYPSLHKKLAEAIEYEGLYEERAFSIFKQPEQGAVYVYGINGDEYYEPIFTTFESALTNLRNTFERQEVQGVKMKKAFLDDGDNNKGKIIAYFDYDVNLQDIDAIAPDNIRAKWFPNANEDASRMFSDDFYVIIPAPFKRGDILTYPLRPKRRSYKVTDEAIFVLESLNNDNPRTLERRMRYEGDGSDMWEWGYFVCDDGLLSEDHMYDYDSFEYYRGKLEGNQRLLQYVSWYLKGEIALTPLLLSQYRIMLQHQLGDGLCLSEWAFPEEHMIAEGQVDHEKRREGV